MTQGGIWNIRKEEITYIYIILYYIIIYYIYYYVILYLEIIILSGTSQLEKDKYHMASFICGI